MILAYFPRLICLSLACFFAVYAATWLFTALLAGRAIAFAKNLPPGRASNLLLTLRLLPGMLAAFVTLGVCTPSYLLFEPELANEPVGVVCLLMTTLAAAMGATGIIRASRALIRSLSFARACRRAGHVSCLALNHPPACVVQTSIPCLALTGLVRPLIVISQGIVDVLSEEEISLVLSHENAHGNAFDNLKRLCFFLAPGPRTLERAWMRFAEYAADQRAANGDRGRSTALASALIRVARLGSTTRISLATSFLPEIPELSTRVNRLLENPPSTGHGQRRYAWLPLTIPVLSPLVLNRFTFRIAHSILERFIQ